MRWILPFLLCLLATPALANRLSGHPSPYLALHAGDATDWRAWDASVLKEARRADKLIMVSLGYFSCHWCHVMQRETWADPDAARLINRHFVAVKVDRETHAALDARLQLFAELTRNRAGWPLTVFLTPDGDPLFAMLYEPRDEFMRVAAALAQRWRQDRAGLRALARAAAQPLARTPAPVLPAAFLSAAAREADVLQGGFGAGAKFPRVPQLAALLAFERRQGDGARREFIKTSLDHMAAGALRDHVGGGFFRYTVDPGWQEPHFEKMLYDNAQLASLYLAAARTLNAPGYRRIGLETLDFMLAAMREGAAFIASLSALDEAGGEGGAYLWQPDALRQALPADEFAAVERVWGLRRPSPFGGHLPFEVSPPSDLEKPLLLQATQRLRAMRAARVIPRDGKLLAGWNGLALSALAEAAEPGSTYQQAAEDVFAFVEQRLVTPHGLLKGLASGKPLGPGELEDYAYLAQGLLDHGRAAERPERRDAARNLAARLIGAAWKKFGGATGLRLESHPLVSGAADPWEDGATPAPAAALVAATLALNDTALNRHALAELARARKQARGNPFNYASLARFANID